MHDYPLSGNCYKVRLLLAQLGIPYERIEWDTRAGETRTPEFLSINPAGKVPVLETEDGKLLPESDAILFYLAEGTPFLPEDRFERAQVLRWMSFEQSVHQPSFAIARFLVQALEMNDERRKMLGQKQKAGYAALETMEGHLEDGGFFVGGRYTVADIALYAYTHVAHEGGFDLRPFPAVRAWLERVASRPAYVPMTEG
ncbi:MAG: glutathione S-transferase [Actinobacteria bacterium]|nr:MAG: glutathione S-transferase [Actinomycetota bacterium]